MPQMVYDDRAVRVSPGDTLFVYTDGLTDRRTAGGEFYSIDRVANLMEHHRDADLNTIYDAINSDVRRFSATDEFKDDIAFIVTRFH
jgi:serine phosphatase RsbU (regulator of sigma subunit)